MNMETHGSLQRVRDMLPNRIVLHIGMTKAGSTAVQNTFARNYDRLLKQGILFPRSVFTRTNPYNLERTPGHLQLAKDLVRGDIETFEQELLSIDRKVRKLVLSAENIFLDIDAAQCGALAGLFEGKNVEIICILREQIGWCASRYYESVAKGNRRETSTFEEFVERLISAGKLDYHARLNDIASSLGADRIVAADYDVLRADGGVVPWFAQIAGLKNATPPEGADQFSNVSKPFPEAIEAHRRINGLIDLFSSDQRFAWTVQMENIAEAARERRGLPAAHVTPSPAVHRRILEACEESNRKLSETFLGGAPFGPDPGALDTPESPPLDEALVNELVTVGIDLLAAPAKVQIRAHRQQKGKLTETKSKLKQRQAATVKLEAKLAAHETALALREEEARREAGRADQATEALTAAHAERAEAEDRARANAAKLADTQARLAAQETALALREEEAWREAGRADAANAERARSEKRAQAERTKAEKRAHEERSHFRRQLDEARMRENRLSEGMAAMRASASWRLTAPLRVLSTGLGLRRLRGGEASAMRATGLGPIAALRHRRQMRGTIRAVAASPLFDAAWYLQNNPDVAARGEDPVQHYLRFGAAEGRDPGPGFRTSWYLKNNPDVAARGMNPLHHYIEHGQKEGRRPIGGGGHVAAKTSNKLSDHEKKRIGALFEKAKSGFMTAGTRDLEALAVQTRGKRIVRQAAAFRLATLLADGPSEADMRKASDLLSELTPGKVPGGTYPGWFVLKLTALLNLGAIDEAQQLVHAAIQHPASHPDILLMGATVEARAAGARGASSNGDAEQVALIARAFHQSAGLGFVKADQTRPLSFDNLSPAAPNATGEGDALVSIVMPTHNCAPYLETCVRSILAQSWTNIELIICDDASTDETPDILSILQDEDCRIRTIRLEENSGAYVARNHALAAARGQFVTCQDADDWSHPERIKRQVDALAANPDVIANASLWARASDRLEFIRAPMATSVLHFNSSSIMFRREPVIERVGYWDSVRFGADTEFWHRLRAAFGDGALNELPEMLALARVRSDSLTRSRGSEYTGAKVGARKAYFHGYSIWHERNRENLQIPFPLTQRPFGVPLRMTPQRPAQEEYDVVIISDFRHLGGNTASNVQEMTAQARAGLKTGIVQVDRYDFATTRPIHHEVQALVDSGAVDMLVHGDHINTRLAIVRFPAIFSEVQDFLPTIEADSIRVVVNQPPRRVKGEPPFYSIETCKQRINEYLGDEGNWVPIGPAVRDALAADDEGHHLSDENWYNIIDVDAWHVPRPGWRADVPVIGRHGRDNFEKWPSKAEDILSAYPEDGSMQVRILGGASIPTKTIGYLPAAWQVLEFNAIPPRDFLANLDFFVFFPHEDRIEAFGRTIIEAMASGCLVVLPSEFAALFGKAAVYCSPGEARDVVMSYYRDREAYEHHIAAAEKIVRNRFGFEQHIERVKKIIDQPDGDTLASSNGLALQGPIAH